MKVHGTDFRLQVAIYQILAKASSALGTAMLKADKIAIRGHGIT